MGKKIIVVDDSRTARQQVAQALEAAGYEVLEAIDGNDGIAKVIAHEDAALIVCDVNMPNLNGIDMIEKLRREMPRLRVPIVMLTTEAHPELLQRAKLAGAKGWIVKPFKQDLLVAAVRKLVGDK